MRRTTLAVLAVLVLSITAAYAEPPPDIDTENGIRTEAKLISTAATGPPIEVTSDALVANLNADKLDGMDSAEFATSTAVNSIFNQTYYTVNGTFIVPTGVTLLNVTVIGGGGGGGGGSATSEGGGGGGGGWVTTRVIEVTPSSTLTVAVGAGGSAGGIGSFGGNGGQSALNGPSPATLKVIADGGLGGFPGGGGVGGQGGAGYYGGGGGSGAVSGTGGIGFLGNGGDGTASSGGAGASGGPGGSGAGASGGGGGTGGGIGQTVFVPGTNGSQPGAGGAGGGAVSNGGTGRAGAVLIQWVGPPLDPF